ncbi:MAG: flavin reductase family protein [Candidatus Sifarchaeia archaeon]
MSGEIDPEALRILSSGLYIVTSHIENKTNGQIVNTVMQVAGDPPCVAVSINKKNLTYNYINKSGMFAISVLDESTPMKFIGRFGFRSGRDIDKLDQISHKKGVYNSPMITEHTLAVLEAKVRDQVDVITHTVFIGEVVCAEFLKEGKPLTYAYYHEVKKGKSPKTAPTYIEPKES